MYKKIFILFGCCLIILGLIGITKASMMPIKAIIGQHYLEVAWKESLKNNKLSKPWKSADFYMIGELKIPKLKVSRVILLLIPISEALLVQEIPHKILFLDFKSYAVTNDTVEVAKIKKLNPILINSLLKNISNEIKIINKKKIYY